MRLFGFIIALTLFSSFSATNNNETFDFDAFRQYYHLNDSVTSSVLSNKVILVEFWASWCQPCRVKNSELNAIYAKYKNRNFEIISVALDTDSLRWRKAIRNDDLGWPTQVRDTAKWNSVFLKQAEVYYLPNNVLVNQDGKVLGREVDTEDLEKVLN
ncbi:MAG: TlpA family protein disulfide reductase [Bacteroidetes bacterium]|jgi:thiol-disulfide isomerase/thioredoxin|nr:TlpA family protein disulfide reductase [Bacteroidota bacterium]